MEEFVLTALVGALSGLAGGALGEAGSEAWRSFEQLVRRHFGRKGRAVDLARRLGEGDATVAVDLATALADETVEDRYFAEELLSVLAIDPRPGHVVNRITGDVSGTAIQGRDIGRIDLRPDRRR